MYAAKLVLAISCLCASLGANDIPPHAMTTALEARHGPASLTSDMLVRLLEDHKTCSLPKWVDSTYLTYSSSGNIQLLDTETLSHTFLGEGKYPTPSPDGGFIAFMHENQLWVMHRDGSERKRLTSISKGILGEIGYHYEFAWSPDSSKLALVFQPLIIPCSSHQDREEPIAQDQSATSAINIEDVVSHPVKTELLLIDVDSGSTRETATFNAGIRDLSWFANGQKLLFMSEVVDVKKFEDNVQVYSLENGEVSTLISFNCQQQFLAPVSSPNSEAVAIAYDADNAGNCMCSIACIDSDKNVKRLTYEMQMHRPQWSHDASKIYALRTYGAYKQIYSIDVASGALHQLTSAPQSINGFRVSPDGTKLVWLAQDAHDTYKIQLATSDGQNIRDLMVIENAPKNIALGRVEEIEWNVTNYPSAMRGLLLLPLNYKEGMKYPLVVDIHGGGPGASIHLPGGILVASPLEWQLWTAKGYAVFVPEFRSSASFGSLAITRDLVQENDMLQQDINDIDAGVDALIARGIADENRVAVIGHSAGARRANWLTVTTTRYRAVVSHDGWADEWLEGGQGIFPYHVHPVLDPHYLQKHSSLFHAKGAVTPTLFLMANPRVGGVDPYNTVLWLYYALKVQGVPTKYFTYPDEGHCFERSANKLHALEQMLDWVEQNSSN